MARLDLASPTADSAGDCVVSRQPGDDVMELWQIMVLWTIGGVGFVWIMPIPESSIRAGVLLFLGGPFTWTVFVYKSLQMWFKGEI